MPSHLALPKPSGAPAERRPCSRAGVGAPGASEPLNRGEGSATLGLAMVMVDRAPRLPRHKSVDRTRQNNLRRNSKVPVALEIVYRDGYPKVLPRVRDTAHRYGGDLTSRHINSDHSFCLTPMTSGEEIATDGPGGFTRFLQAVISFLVRQEKFEITGRWRGPAADHGLSGLLKYHYDRYPFRWSGQELERVAA